MKYLTDAIKNLVFIVLSFLVCCAGLTWHTVRLDLVHRPFAYAFTYVIAWGTIWVCGIAYKFSSSQLMKRTATGLVAVVGLLLGWQTFAYYAHDSADAVTTLSEYAGQKIQETAKRVVQEAPTEVVCNKDTYRHMTFFVKDATTNQRIPKVWYEDRDGVITCFKSGGYHPLYGTNLKLITEAIVLQIAEQKAPQPVSTPTPSPAPQAATIVWGPEQLVPVMNEEEPRS